MDVGSQLERRDVTAKRRRAPGKPVCLRLPFTDPVTVRDNSPVGPIELEIESTNADGDFAQWLDDDWWAEAITHWADDDVTVRIAPTPGALTHPILCHQIAMLRRVVPGWRLVAYAYRDDVELEAGLSAVATSPYHEIRFLDEVRPHRLNADRRQPAPVLPVLFSRMRTVQAQRRVSTPILVRLPALLPRATPRSLEARDATRAPVGGPADAVARVLDTTSK